MRKIYKESYANFFTIWISKLTIRNHISNERKIKINKHQRNEKYDINEVITEVKHQIRNFRITKIINK